ncbi:MAG: hypothetical protein H2173_10140 [Opitutus sp.]|nr:hypothetical protein [Opitutus sp.]MCS6274321.1 hypothetical protein [Opitutus sp.]
MPIVVSHRIRQKEFGAKIPRADTNALLRTARVALATPIAAKGLPAKTRLLKGYATTPNGPRRVVYLLGVEDGTLFLLFYRDKNDPVGQNISPQNPAFSKQLEKHLAFLLSDLTTNEFDVIE